MSDKQLLTFILSELIKRGYLVYNSDGDYVLSSELQILADDL